MARQCQAQMDKQGRLYIPKATREALGIEGESANVNLEVEVIEDE
jgi:bifunctional DNA-binding transcriptional regulator/antitoxin component of YhaV-PrlF toxin-antitoxin module